MNHVPSVKTVNGTTKTQYSQILLEIDHVPEDVLLPGVKLKKLILKIALSRGRVLMREPESRKGTGRLLKHM